MKLGSLFDGSGGFPLAGAMNGIEPVWASEVEPFPIAVTKLRFPNMKHLGSVMDVNGNEIEPVDIITFGSPCQDLSVAGKRAGLEGERSGLFMEQIRIVKEMRDATANDDIRLVRPRYMVWENVPGAFSSNQGKDFQAVLTEIVRIAEPNAPDVPLPAKWGVQGVSTMKWVNGALLGEYTMRSFGESPREENESRLSQILQDSAQQKYYLSARACAGILNRAQKRGKELPEILQQALERQMNDGADSVS